jgi:flavodoxin
MEHIIVSGCSFTSPNYKSFIPTHDASLYKKWPDYIPDAKITNVGEDGVSNTHIIENALIELIKADNVDRVIIALSDWWRTQLPQNMYRNIRTINPRIVFYDNKSEGAALSVITAEHKKYCDANKWYVDMPYVQTYAINETLRSIMTLYSLCKARGVKLDIFQMISGQLADALNIDGKNIDHSFALEVMSHEWFILLDKLQGKGGLSLIGWPFFSCIGGEYANDILEPIHRIKPGEDDHPNEEGHKLIWEWYNKHAQI